MSEVLSKLYSATPDGHCGDEDNGQTLACYVFSAFGFYPVTSAVDEYVIGSPLFEKATLHLENGNTIVINSENNSSKNVYTFKMSNKPNMEWGNGKMMCVRLKK